jgi:ribosomal-protein-alanine N-acetyltransferase
MNLIIRPYEQRDKSDVIGLFNSNTPEFFHPSEEKNLVSYLENEVEDYFVIEQDAMIVGAGGINYFEHEKLARISWDIVSPNSHGMGVGKKLTEFRINHLKERKAIETIVVRTTQIVYKFYEKMGFKLIKVTNDFWAEDIDLYHMELKNAH